MTYLNKGQFYPVTLKEVSGSEAVHHPIGKVRVSPALGWLELFIAGPRWISIKIPVVETPCSHYGEIGIHPCSGNGDPACCTGWPKN